MHNIYIGYDPKEAIAFDVARHSLYARTSSPVEVIPLRLKKLGHILTRPIELKNDKLWCPISQAPMSTEFAISRFCVPFLQKEGWALFIDCDMLFQDDVKKLFDLANDKYAVMVVKHKQLVNESTKMSGQIQTIYERKNWSSVVLWNCSHPANKNLTLEALNTWPGRDLHAFRWLKDEEIGELPQEWNYLVDVNKPKLIHFTLGGPWFEEKNDCNYSKEWLDELENMKATTCSCSPCLCGRC
jgi:lipopolysaccharide biosynthesis glycosyltransferase